MKIMISQPMKDKSKEEIIKDRENLVKIFQEKGYEIINTVFNYTFVGGNVPVKFLARAIDKLADADEVCFMNGWDKARGCKIEHQICKEYGIKISYEKDYINE